MRSLGWAAALALVVACGDRGGGGQVDAPLPAAEPAAGSGEGVPAPKSADCRSWADLDPDTLPPLPESPHTATFESVWLTVLQKHYDPTLACSDWPAIRELYGNKAAAAADTKAAYAEINAMLSTLGQSHLRAVPPSDATEAQTRRKNTGPAVVPVSVRILEGKAIVTEARLDEHESGLPVGAVLVDVDGEAVEDIVAPPLAASGREVERRLRAGRAVFSALHCPEGGEKQVTYLDPRESDATKKATVACVMPAATESLGNLRDVPVRVRWRMLDGTEVGYLAFNVWMVPLMASKIRPALAELKQAGMAALILDLRGNPGGVGAMSIPMARELSTQKLDLGRLQMRDMAQEYKPEANPDAFAGPVVLLVDEGTASTSEIFAMGMRDAGRVSIVGASTSAGMALPSLMEELPDGGRLQYVVGDYTSPKGTVAEGEGVRPDVLVTERRADYVAGKDPVLSAALELAEKEIRGGK